MNVLIVQAFVHLVTIMSVAMRERQRQRETDRQFELERERESDLERESPIWRERERVRFGETEFDLERDRQAGRQRVPFVILPTLPPLKECSGGRWEGVTGLLLTEKDISPKEWFTMRKGVCDVREVKMVETRYATDANLLQP